MMHVAVAIVGFRNAEDIARCLQSLSRSTHEDFEVVICENGGPDHFARLTSLLPVTLERGQAVRVVLGPGNPGYGGGVNICMRETPQADAWWVLNPDTQPTPDGLASLVARLASGDCEAVGGPVYLDDATVQSYGGFWQAWSGRASSIGRGTAQSAPVDAREVERRQNYLNGASMLIGRKFLNAVGPMREDYFLYCEEVEWCLRARNRNMRLGFAPAGTVLHHQGATTGGNAVNGPPSRLAIYLGERNKILMTRDIFPVYLFGVAVTGFLLQLARYRRHGGWRGLRYGIGGLVDGLRNRRGIPNWLS